MPAIALTPDQIQRSTKLEGIFLPHARKQRDDLYAGYADEDSPRFVHYTSARNALSIIQTKRLWMRNTNCMADFREVQHGFDILAKFFSDKPKLDGFTSAVDQCAPGIALEAINLFNQWWTDTRQHTYISSISEHLSTEDVHGRLSMWRAFGDDTAKVGIVFRIPKLSGAAMSLALLFSPVAYLTEIETHDLIGQVIENVNSNTDFLQGIDRGEILAWVFTMLLSGVTCQKHEGFTEEREWRAIYSPNRNPSPLMENSIEVISDIPQTIYKIPLDSSMSSELADLDFAVMFDRLIIGPTQYPVVMMDTFKTALEASGVANAGEKIFASLIPIRT